MGRVQLERDPRRDARDPLRGLRQRGQRHPLPDRGLREEPQAEHHQRDRWQRHRPERDVSRPDERFATPAASRPATACTLRDRRHGRRARSPTTRSSGTPTRTPSQVLSSASATTGHHAATAREPTSLLCRVTDTDGITAETLLSVTIENNDVAAAGDHPGAAGPGPARGGPPRGERLEPARRERRGRERDHRPDAAPPRTTSASSASACRSTASIPGPKRRRDVAPWTGTQLVSLVGANFVITARA